MTERTYLLRVLSEPTEDPITLTQQELDALLHAGLTLLIGSALEPETPLPPAQAADEDILEGLIDFAEISTSDGGPFLYRKHPLDQDTADKLLQLGFTSAIDNLMRRSK